jgi:peptidoglycan/LPS O-acetylase OafA/YrhL
VPALDGLRGLAILVVVTGHFTGRPPGGGGAGVGLFFVLSGFLITTLLIEERQMSGQIGLKAFYARRARRLFPALAVLLCVYLVVLGIRGRNGLETVALGGLYAGNFVQAFVPGNPVMRSALGHLWSLAQEEQFYLVWPLLLIFARRRLVPWLGFAFIALAGYRALLVAHGASVIRLWFGPDTHSDWLVVGALLAALRIQGWLRVREPVPIIGFALFNVAVLTSYAQVRWQVLGPGYALGCAFLVAAAVTETQMASLLACRPLVALGRISYSLYLWHIPIFFAFGQRNVPASLVASLAAAWLSYRFVEQPFKRRRSARLPVVELPSAAAEPT